MKKIRLLLEYGCFPVWLYDEEEDMIDNDLPEELSTDKELVHLCNQIQKKYDGLFINSEVEFEYRGFSSLEDEEGFKKEAELLEKVLRERCDGLYIIQNDMNGL